MQHQGVVELLLEELELLLLLIQMKVHGELVVHSSKV